MGLFDFLKKKPELKKEEELVKKEGYIKKEGYVKKEKIVTPKIKPILKKEVKKPKVKTKVSHDAEPIVEVEKKTDKSEKKLKPAKPRKTVKSKVAWRVLERPHITEKATALTKNNEYVFRVSSRSNKIEVKRAVEDVYGVQVEKVRVINIPAKKRRLGKTQGWRKGYKKAIVKVKKGQEIQVLPR